MVAAALRRGLPTDHTNWPRRRHDKYCCSPHVHPNTMSRESQFVLSMFVAARSALLETHTLLLLSMPNAVPSPCLPGAAWPAGS